MRQWRTKLATVTAVASMVLLGSVATGPASVAAQPYCGITWGSLPKQGSPAGSGPVPTVADVRAGRHTCYDRLVLDIDGGAGRYWVRYVDYVARDGSGFIVPLEGGAKLQVVVGASGYDENYHPTYAPPNSAWLADVRGFRTFRQAAWGGSFEATSTVGVGVRARLPFRVFVLDGPGSGSRLVVDVAHRW